MELSGVLLRRYTQNVGRYGFIIHKRFVTCCLNLSRTLENEKNRRRFAERKLFLRNPLPVHREK